MAERHTLSRWLRYGLVVCAVLSVCFVLGLSDASWRVRHAEQHWASSFESMDAFAARFPRAGTSAGVRHLHELTQPLGIDMVAPTPRNDSLDAVAAFVGAQQFLAQTTTE